MEKKEPINRLPSLIIKDVIDIIASNEATKKDHNQLIILAALKSRLEIEERYYMEKAYIVGWECGFEECGSSHRGKKEESLIIDFETFYNKTKNEQ